MLETILSNKLEPRIINFLFFFNFDKLHEKDFTNL